MNRSKLILACLLSAGALATVSAQEVKLNIPGQSAQAAAPAPAADAAKPAAVGVAAPTFTESQLLEAYGWFVGKRLGLTELEFNRDQVESLVKGLVASAAGKDAPYDFEKLSPQLDAFMQKKQEAFLTKVRNAKMLESKVFFEKLKENKNVVELPSGLRYEILQKGTGSAPEGGQTAVVAYKGTFVDGQTFDMSEPGHPAELILQVPSQKDPRGIIPGMVEGMQKIGKGGKIRLYIPPHLAYGDEGQQGIPPGATLVFEVELVDVKATPPPPAASKS